MAVRALKAVQPHGHARGGAYFSPHGLHAWGAAFLLLRAALSTVLQVAAGPARVLTRQMTER